MYMKTLAKGLMDALEKASEVKLQPKEFIYFRINEDYQLKVYCYCGLVRHYSIRENNECVCNSWTEEWIIHLFLD